MKLAVRKEPGAIPGSGFHYMLVPKILEESEVPIWEQMGHIVIEVQEHHGQRLLLQAGAALHHQMEVAFLTEDAIKSQSLAVP